MERFWNVRSVADNKYQASVLKQLKFPIFYCDFVSICVFWLFFVTDFVFLFWILLLWFIIFFSSSVCLCSLCHHMLLLLFYTVPILLSPPMPTHLFPIIISLSCSQVPHYPQPPYSLCFSHFTSWASLGSMPNQVLLSSLGLFLGIFLKRSSFCCLCSFLFLFKIKFILFEFILFSRHSPL